MPAVSSLTPARRHAQRAWQLLHVDAAKAHQLLEQAMELGTQQQDALGLAHAHLTRGFHRLYFATPGEARLDLEAARQTFRDLADRAGEILACTGLARAQWRLGGAREALDSLVPLRDEGLALLRGEERAVMLNAIAGCHSSLGNSESAFAYMYEALAEVSPKRGNGYDIALYCNLSHELLELGDFDEALRLVERGLERIASVSNGRLETVLLVNRALCLTELGRAGEALASVRRIAEAERDPAGRGLVPGHFESLALTALRAGDRLLGRALIARATAALPDERLGLQLARALEAKLGGQVDAGLQALAEVAPLLNAVGDARPSLRLRCAHALILAELHEAAGDAAAALAALRLWQRLHAERTQRASSARYQATMLQTELMQLQRRVEEHQTRRQAAERERMQLADAHDRLQRKMAEIEALQAQLQLQATQDALTSLANRRHFNDTLPALLALAQREGTPLSVVLIDLDHFKQVNDAHGHPAGDLLLGSFGALLRSHLRKSDQAFRYGGEEFCLLLPHTPAADAHRKVEGLLAEWSSQAFELDGGTRLRGQSFSAGVTDSLQHPGPPQALLRAADDLLLQAKRDGRHRVCAAAPTHTHMP